MQSIVDLTYLETVCEGDKEFMREMIQAFVSSVPGSINEIKTLASGGEWAEVAKVSHKMKPSVTFMGIEPMKEKIVELETGAKKGDEPVMLQKLIGEIEQIVQRAIIELNAALESL